MGILSFLRTDRSPSNEATTSRVEPAVDGSATASYPSVDPGVEARNVEQILSAHEDLIARIKLCYGSDRPTFEADLLTPIRNFAGFVNLLPATADNFHCEVGGLFRLGLEVAFFALQGTDGHIVSGRSTISTRRHLEPRWRHATFLAGLCSEIHRTLSHAAITDEQGDEWPAYLGPLTSWLTKRRSRRFFIRWIANAQESRSLGVFALPHIVPPETMQHLATGNSVAVPQMLSCVAGIPLYREQNILADLVKRAAALVIDRDLIASANRYGRPILGAHLERYLLDAMRRLVVSHAAWAPNQDRSRVWYGTDGLFIVWPNAVTEMRKLLEEDELPGIPKAPETILEILLGAGVFVGRGAAEPLWSISPPPGKTVMDAAKLCAPELLLPALAAPLAPLSVLLAASTSSQRNVVTATGPTSPQPDLLQEQPTATPGPPPGADHGSTSPHDTSPGPTTSHSTGAEAEPAPPTPAPEPVVFKLAAPMRLNPRVRDALAQAIDSMNGDARQSVAITVPTGIFVPLDHFKRARLDLPVVLRALAETGMTVGGNPARVNTVEHELGGQPQIGFVLRASFVHGLDPSDFATN